MKSKSVQLSLLSDNWCAAKHFEPSEDTLDAAKMAGWASGTRGTAKPRGEYADHCVQAVRTVFWEAHKKGIAAREKFIGPQEDSK